jgi:hypothetical protein
MSEVPDVPEIASVRRILERMQGSCGFVEDGEPLSMEHPHEDIYEAIRDLHGALTLLTALVQNMRENQAPPNWELS